MSDFHRYRNLSQEALGRARVISGERGFIASEYRLLLAPTRGIDWWVAISTAGTIDTHYRQGRAVLENDLRAAGYERARYRPDYWERRSEEAA